MVENRSDEEIVRAVVSGSTALFSELVHRHQNMVYGIALRILRDEEEALDCSQDAFVKGFQNISSFEARAPFKHWMARIVHNTALTRASGKPQTAVVFGDEIPSRERNFEVDVERDEIRQVLRSAIDSLPQEYRLCLDLHFFEGFSIAEITGITGIPEGTVKSNVYRAKRSLYSMLKGTVAEGYNEM